MKRYRVLTFDFDTRATILSTDIQDSWEPQVKEMWHDNKNKIMEGLIAEFGIIGGFQKIKNFTDLGSAPFSIIAFHNKFFRQVRYSFVIGAFYPALTATCALVERILNQLILHLRNCYISTSEYKKVYRKDSFDNWDLAIDTLESWGVLLPNIAAKFRELRDIRNRALHFNPETDENDRELALDAISKLSDIINGQFSAFGPLPWFILQTAGVTFIKKSYEKVPFVEKILLQNCTLVGPFHTLELKNNTWIVHDNYKYEEREISDEEFAELFNNRKI